MEKTRAISNSKKCPYCDKRYPADTDRINCDCDRHGRLFVVGTWHQPKTGGRADGN